MNLLYRIVILGPIAVSLMVITTLGQTTVPPSSSGFTTTENIEVERIELYNKVAENHKKDPPRAYKTACDYLQRFGADESDLTQFVKNFARRFAKGKQQQHVIQLLNEKGYDEENYAEAFRFGKQMLKAEPSDFITLHILVQAGKIALERGNKAYRDETAEYAKRALVLIEKETTLTDKESDLSVLYVSLGVLYLISDENASRYYFSKLSELEKVKNDPQIYVHIAVAVIRAEFEPLYTELYLRDRTPQQLRSKEAAVMRDRLYFIADVIVDALARAIALAGSDPSFSHLIPKWREMLSKYYRYRNGGRTTTGLSKLIRGIMDVPFPRTSLHHF